MLNLLFTFGFLLGLVLVMLVAAGLLNAVVSVLAWLDVFAATLGDQIKQRAGHDQASALTTPSG
jgi:hypothetical protein